MTDSGKYNGNIRSATMKAFVIAALLVVQIVAPNPWDDLLGGLTELSDADLFDLAQMGLPDELETLSSLSSVASIQLLEPEPVPQPEFLFSSDDSYVVGGQITCPGALPPQNLFPPGVSRVSYKDSLHFLCSQVGGANTFDPRGHLATRNMGCICANPGVSSDVICQAPPFSYPPIYDSDLLIQCELLCECLGKPPILKGLWFPGSPKVAESYSDSFYAFRRADGVIVALIKQPDGSIITHVLPGTKYGGVSHAHLPFNPAPDRGPE
ncbi:MAG: hypothetical protein M1814_001881 [Vezdaea aestivalis]|nr:MAG: hypothetical protein M1814_001881 [Vezdaea aestivalis]